MKLPLAVLAALAATVLASRALRRRAMPLAARIDAVLPQTQCRQCGYAGCRPYAEAVVAGEAINRCPPGGNAVIRKLARITRRPALELDPACGTHEPRRIVRIDEANCIGCTLCIQACPVDAIVGAPKLMHTVISDLCTGCELCLPPCPVDCIVVEPRPWRLADLLPGARRRGADAFRRRFEQRNARLERERRSHAQRMAARASRKTADAARGSADDAEARKRAIVQAALERARAKLAGISR